MDGEPPFAFVEAARFLDGEEVTFLLIGRQAVRLYGAPVQTSDYDLWVDPGRRAEVLRWFQARGFELSDEVDGQRPIVFATRGLDKVDLLFLRSIANQEGQRLELDAVYRAARIVVDPASGVAFGVPAIDDLIALKKCRLPHARDAEDLRYLAVRKALAAKGDPP